MSSSRNKKAASTAGLRDADASSSDHKQTPGAQEFHGRCESVAAGDAHVHHHYQATAHGSTRALRGSSYQLTELEFFAIKDTMLRMSVMSCLTANASGDLGLTCEELNAVFDSVWLELRDVIEACEKRAGSKQQT